MGIFRNRVVATNDEVSWTGPWAVNPRTRTLERPYLHRDFQSGELTDIELVKFGDMIRPGVLRDVVHLDAPLVALHSHPDTPHALSEENEGIWMDTNPAWPEQSVDVRLGQLGLRAVWHDSPAGSIEEFDGLMATVVYVVPGRPHSTQ